MVTKKTTKKSAKKTAKKGTKKAAGKGAKKGAKKTARKAASASRARGTKARKPSSKSGPSKRPAATPTKGRGRQRPANGDDAQDVLRVRMYRIGFGDFFLLTVPTKSGPQHILIDCGVHAGDIGTMDACVKDLMRETNLRLALVIVTHFHADHISGFASNFDDFAQFDVGAVWITNRLDPKDKDALKMHMQLKSLANQLQLGLRLRLGLKEGEEPGSGIELAQAQAVYKAENALGITLGAKEREGKNDKALRLLTSGFNNHPTVYYYQAGDEPFLPEELREDLTAELLGPAPKDSGGMFSGKENSAAQYLAAAADDGVPETDCLEPFEAKWNGIADAHSYPSDAFNGFKPYTKMEKVLEDSQPDALLAMADTLDGTLNNQSLVILFTCQGKKLLFVGDAQWGNWSYWLYGKKMSGEALGITPTAKEILGSIDFYKVGHHGSTNANPIPAMKVINQDCVSMCSTESADYDRNKPRPHGSLENESEVPRTVLMEA
ncbi:MAG TPA: MBL fold metallo-hydrolase, partial [Pyrinomonadaceae bacterium]|nr:MBL fold metallo-hydrolase [Pyrinomonadaceae bacterium]